MSDQQTSSNNIRRSPFGGYSLQLLGTVLVFIGAACCVVLFFLAKAPPSRAPKVGILNYIILILGTAMMPLGKYCSRLGRQLTAFSADELLEKDKRPSVLYLRSFKDDVIAANRAGRRGLSPDLASITSTYVPFTADDLAKDTEEEVLANELMQIGPAVAVGIPGEELPELGMARMYFRDDEWQEKVLDLMLRSQLVVMRAGDTEGFWRELNMVVKHLNPEKLLLLLPFEPWLLNELSISPTPSSDEYTRFCEKAEKILPKKLPDFHGKRVPGSSLAGMVWFDSNWNPKIYDFGQLGIPLKETLRYVFKHY